MDLGSSKNKKDKDLKKRPSSSNSLEVLPLKGTYVREIDTRLLCNPPAQLYRTEAVPFHIPHKKLLETIEYHKEDPEPLAGFLNIRHQVKQVKRESSTNSLIRQFSSEPSSEKISNEYFITAPFSLHDHNAIINQMRHTKDGSFIYLTYAVPKSSEYYTPYNFNIVPFKYADKKNYFTMTCDGVMQFIGNDTIFTPLDKWQFEYDMYCKIMNYRTFKKFRMWKGFFVWKKYISYKKMKKARTFLADNLFVLDDDLRQGILDVQNMCHKIYDITFVDSTEIENIYLFYFIEDQLGKLETVSNKLNEFREVAKEIIYNACHGSLLAKGFVPYEAPEKRKVGKLVKLSYIEQATKKKVCRRLSSYIILLDYIKNDILHHIVEESVKQIKEILVKHIQFLPANIEVDLNFDKSDLDLFKVQLEGQRPEDDPQFPLFIINILADSQKLFFDPSIGITFMVFEKIIDLWKNRCISITSFISDKIFDPFTEPMINMKIENRICGDAPSLLFYLEHNDTLNQNISDIFELFQRNFDKAQEFTNQFEFIREFFAEDQQVTEEMIESETSYETFRGWCQRYHKEVDILENIFEDQPFGILLLKTVELKKIVLPESQRLIHIIEHIMPIIGKDKVDYLMEESEEIQMFFSQEPVTTTEYVKYIEFIEACIIKIETMEEDLEYCKEMYDIMEEFKIAIPTDDLANYLGVSVLVGGVRSLVDKKTECMDKYAKAFSEQMNKDISNLISEVGTIKTECMQAWLYDINSNIEEVLDFLNDLYDRLLDCQTRSTEFKNFQKQFRLEVMRFEMLDEVMSDVKLRILLWDSITQWSKSVEDWYNAEFNTLDIEEMNTFIAKNLKNINSFEKGLPRNLIVPKLKDDVELMKNKLPVVGYLRNPCLRQRHWTKIENILNYKFKADEFVNLKLLEELVIFKYPEDLMEVSAQASSEAGLEIMLKKVEESWKTLEFNIMQHKDAKDVFILGSTEEVQIVLDESFIAMNTIMSSRHVGPIKPRVDEWTKQLNLFSKVLDEWLACQQSWVYLEVIFSAPDIQRQLPNEAKLFTIVDKAWKQIMRQTSKMPLAMEAAQQPGLLETLHNNNVLLEQIMKCLESYLEIKRVAFPRFYFLSNDELLEILAQTRNPHAVQPHLRKCFDAIAKLEFGIKEPEEDENAEAKSKPEPSSGKAKDVKKSKSVAVVLTTDIVAMISPEGERVPLSKGLKARGNVEDWLGKVEAAMWFTLRRLMKASLIDYMSRERVTWVLNHANQIILTVSQIMWARMIHEILDKSKNVPMDLKNFEQKCINDLNDLAGVIRTDISSVTRKILIALITIDVHARDTVSNLVENKVDKSTSFEWYKVLRYYWEDVIDDCVARMSSSSYIYGYEYLGASGVLVITPLTDRCYLCLMGALQFDLGGAPAGPAGTGKTETTKDLAKALAIQCVVFNCSEGLDYKMMGRFFSGLAQSGAWCCFDEFNRIDIEVLSVIAQQIITIRNAKAAKLSRFMFEGREIKLQPRCAAFITMNPGYAGRTELPDNLKALFRPISMMVPDYALIAEVILYSEGFESSKILSQKMVQMYKLCSEQLSQQDHYDFGMRAVKSVLVMAGSLKRANPDRNEDIVLICALRDSNLPKFLSDDAILFQGILNDLFPGVELPVQDYGAFQEAIVESLIEQTLQPEMSMIRKVIQLYETMVVRWGVMLVGPTGGGKSSVLNTLNLSLGKMFAAGITGHYFTPVHTYIINPKAVTAGELYGEVNPFTLEWRDGLMGIMTRTAVQAINEDNQWIICDGPVDAVWIENLNTVLDDNKMLCLANSERIKLTPWVHMIFEVQDLAQASPATVSRCGMVYIDSEELKWLPYVKSWLEKLSTDLLNKEMKDFLLSLFELVVENGFIFLKKNCSYTIHQVDISKASMLCALIYSCLSVPKSMDAVGEKNKVRTYICQVFIWSYLWSLGGNISEDSREKFEGFVMSQFDEHPDARIPPGHDLWSLYMNFTTHKLEPWNKIIPTFQYNNEMPFFEMLVPTVDTVRFGYVMERLLYVDRPVLLTGDTGVGKSIIAKNVLDKLFETNLFVPVMINFSAQTSSVRTQEMVELKLEKKKKTLLGAPFGKKVVIFVDDVNMPKLETYGAQPPIELIRQFLDYGGFYDREKLFWKDVKDVIMTAACAPPGGGRNPLTPRFIRHFSMLQIPPPNELSLKAIFKAILKGFLSEFSGDVKNLGDPIVNACVDLYLRIETDLLPTPAKSHYVFNLRDLSKCVQGILQADPGTLREEIVMLRLFYHECLRVFHDRLINMEDKTYFYFLMKEVCSKNFANPVVDLPDESPIKNPPIILFGDFMQMGASKEDRIYEEARNIDKVKNILQDYLDDYNIVEGKDMKLIFFLDAIEHCFRIARILRSERGNALLVGVGGMGKQSLTKLSSHLNNYRCFTIELTKNYDQASFFEDLRKVYYNAGGVNENTVFLFNDTQIVQEEFLEFINNTLNSGEVPNLFEADEYEKVIIAVRQFAKEYGVAENNREGLYELFIRRVRSNLHVVLCMSPVGENFRRRCRMFPSLVNCCTIDWFEKWPQEALESVALNSLKDYGDEKACRDLSKICVIIHESVEDMTKTFYEEMNRHYYTTPSSYLELLNLYRTLMERKGEKIIATRDKIANGLRKLYETNDMIDDMKKMLTALEPELAKKSKAVAELMVSLEKQQKQVDKVRAVVKKDEEAAKEKADETQALADDAQRDLDVALPALEAATKALESLNKNDINELKVFQKPPQLVQFVVEAICLLLGAKTDWTSAKILLSDLNFLRRLQEYDKDHITDAMLRKLKPYVDHPNFIPEKVAAVSRVCKSLCMWVKAIDMYAKTFKIVEPKRKRLLMAEKELNETLIFLKEKQKQLADVEAMIANLQKQFENSVAEQQSLEDNMVLTSNRLERAGRLNVALADEQIRWEESVKIFAVLIGNILGDILIAAACVAYLGAFTNDYRLRLIHLWEHTFKVLKVPVTENFSLITVLGDQYEIRNWNSYGLPRDNTSTENGILVTEGNKWALMIDPQEQANRWIRQMEAKNDLKIIKMTDSYFMRTLETAIRAGNSVLLEEIGETLDPSLGPILLKQFYVQAGRTLIRLGDNEIEYDKNFRFFMTTKMANPHYLPEICILVTIVNFTVTPSGLEDQLLSDVVRLERPDLEAQRTELVTKINEDKSLLKNIEDKILRLLYQSEGNILDDEELIETLNDSKETSAIINARLAESETTEKKISEAREKYRSVATRGSVLYFVVAQLAEIDPMYQFSLKYFKQIFNVVTLTSEKNDDLDIRLEILINEITIAVYKNVSRGLFERHKLVFSFLVCISIYLQANEISESEWNFLLRGPVLTKMKIPEIPHPMITKNTWNSANYLKFLLKEFKEFPDNILKVIRLKIGDFECTIRSVPGLTERSTINWNHSLSDFKKLLLIKTLKEESLVFAITEYVKKNLGKLFIESPQISLASLYQDISNTVPLVFILSTGSDPFGAFQRFADEMGFRERIQSISLGQGQGPVAEKIIELGIERGDWVFLQNCHLATSWMLSMERIVLKIGEDSRVHNDFRLYMSSMPSKAFPVSVLQNSVKVTNEPPKGIRANMKRAFNEMDESYFHDNPLEQTWKSMIFGLCMFHAVIQERKKFGPLGWNIIYEFNDSDREFAFNTLKMFTTDTYIAWDALEYLTGEITYGGRVTDYWDLRCLKTILKIFFSPKILRTNYKYSHSGVYYCPHFDELVDYQNFIDSFPILEEPEIFGMHENANIAYQIKETQNVLRTITDSQSRAGGGTEGVSTDTIVYDLATSIISVIMEKINIDEIHPRLLKRDDKGRLPSTTTVILQEVDRYNILLKLLHSSMENLKKAIKGFVVMSEALEEVYKAFMNNQVPNMWSARSYNSLKSLGSWVTDLTLRLDFIYIWVKYGHPTSYWLPGFYFPQGFLTGNLQTHARKYNLPIDRLKFDFKIMENYIYQEDVKQVHDNEGKENFKVYGKIKRPDDGVLVHGLFIDAGRWDNNNHILVDARPGEINPPLPVVWLIPTTKPPNTEKKYLAPLYKTSIRAGVLSTTGHSTNFVIAVLLPTDRKENYWILKGTALLTQITN